MDTLAALSELQDLDGRSVRLCPPGSVRGLDEHSDVRGLPVTVLASDHSFLLVEMSEGSHKGRRFRVPKDRYDIEIV